MTLPGFPEAAPLAGLAGGALIGLAAAVMLLGLGRIAGVSGLAARAVGLSGQGIQRAAAWAFVAGLPLGALIIIALTGQLDPVFASTPYLIVAGLLVGIGTRVGSGCTSGHGVCGMSRFSQRSIVATLTFMAAGIATVFLLNTLGMETLK